MADLIRRSPCEVYTKYLIVHPSAMNNDAIREALESKGLFCLSDRYLDYLRALCRPPVQFFPRDATHEPTARFLKAHGIYEMFHPTPESVTALKMLEFPRVKEAIESLSLSGAPDENIAMLIRKRFHFDATFKDVETFRWLFWNVDVLSRTELRALLDVPMIKAAKSGDFELEAQGAAFKHAMYMDSRRLAADLPASPLSSILAHARFGFMPPEVDYVDTLKKSRGVIAARVLEAALLGGPKAGKLASEWAVTLQSVNGVLEQVARPEDELRQHVGKLALKAGTRKLITLDDLTQGEYNVDYAALPESAVSRSEQEELDEDEDLSSIGGEDFEELEELEEET